MKHIWRGASLALALLLAAMAPALATNCSSYTYTLTNGTTADANQVMSNFNTIMTCANSNLAHNGANSDITSLSALSTPLSVGQGGTGLGTLTANNFILGNGTGTPTFMPIFYPQPQGRLTLQSGHPVATQDEVTQTTIYYDAYTGQTVPVWNGSAIANLAIGSNEISMGLDSGVPHIASGSLYDVFAVNNSGTLVMCAGPAWSSGTSRGTGAGTTQLALNAGLWTNGFSLAHCWGGASGTTDYGTVSANQGTYLGTLYAVANGETTVQFKPAAASGGSATVMGLWNAYNRVPIFSRSQDSTASWSYTTGTWRSADNSTSNRITFIDGLQQSFLGCSYTAGLNMSTSATAETGCDLNSTSATPTGLQGVLVTGSGSGINAGAVRGEDNFSPVLGLNYVQAMEYGSANIANWIGGNQMLLLLRMEN